MSDDQTTPEPLKRVSYVTTKRIQVALSQITMDPERYCHRPSDALTEDQLKPLMDSLVLEGMQVPIEGYLDEHDRFIPIKGHRRIKAHLLLVARNTTGFTPDMKLDAILLEDCSLQDRLVRSIADNEVRLNLDRVSRVRAVKKLHDGGVDDTRGAAAFGMSQKTYQRDLLLAKHAWMLQHVIDECIEPTAATDILDAAEKADRMAAVKEDMDAVIAAKKRAIREKEKIRKIQGGKELSDSERQVKRLIKPHMLDHWEELIKKGERFDESAEWEYDAQLDLETKQLKVPSTNVKYEEIDPEQLAKMAAKYSLLSKMLAPIVKDLLAKKQQVDQGEIPQYDLDYLKEIGADDVIEREKQRVEKAKAEPVDGVPHPMDEPEEREETDLASQIEQPTVASPETPAEASGPPKPPEATPKKPREKKETPPEKPTSTR